MNLFLHRVQKHKTGQVSATGFFYHLTPQKVLEALEYAGFEPSAQCMILNSYENRVFSVVLENGQTVVVKFYRPARWSYNQIKEEHDFLFELESLEIPVCAPLKFNKNKSIAQIENIFFAVWPLTGGREPDEFDDEQLMILGRLLARLHNSGASLRARHRLVFDSNSMVVKPLEYIENSGSINAALFSDYKKAALSVKEIYDRYTENVPLHRIHGDCHLSNLLYGKDGWYLLDFDDMSTGPAVQDIWMLLQNSKNYNWQLNVLLDGYRQFRDFEDTWLRLIEPLRAMRYIYYTGWISKRKDDPAFQHAFSHYGTEEYWVKELNDLRDQLKLIYENEPGISQPEQLPELTNKDFFFDWEDD